MTIELKIYIDGLKKYVKRKVKVKDSLCLQTFCEYVIISLNGDCKHLYQLTKNEEITFLGPGCDIIDCFSEEMMNDLTL